AKEVKHMTDGNPFAPHTGLTAAQGGDGGKRPTARTLLRLYALIACTGLLTVALGASTGSALGGVALLLGLVGVGLGVIGAIWCGLAVRRAGRGGDPASPPS